MTDLNASAGDPADVLARTLYGEARGQGEACMRAIASVVLNRVRTSQANGGRHWWGSDIRSVSRAAGQFRCWNPGNPDRAVILSADASDPDFGLALRVAEDALADRIPDPTFGATFYRVASEPWRYSLGRPREPLVTIGPLEFHDFRELAD